MSDAKPSAWAMERAQEVFDRTGAPWTFDAAHEARIVSSVAFALDAARVAGAESALLAAARACDAVGGNEDNADIAFVVGARACAKAIRAIPAREVAGGGVKP